MTQTADWWRKRDALVADFLDDNDSEELVELTKDAKDPKVVSIRKQFKDTGKLSTRQDAVLAGWLAEEKMEYDDEEDE